MKLLKIIQGGHYTAKVYADPDWNEYRVKYFKDGKALGAATDSFADTQEDAIGTANAELKFMCERSSKHE